MSKFQQDIRSQTIPASSVDVQKLDIADASAM